MARVFKRIMLRYISVYLDLYFLRMKYHANDMLLNAPLTKPVSLRVYFLCVYKFPLRV